MRKLLDEKVECSECDSDDVEFAVILYKYQPNTGRKGELRCNSCEHDEEATMFFALDYEGLDIVYEDP